MLRVHLVEQSVNISVNTRCSKNMHFISYMECFFFSFSDFALLAMDKDPKCFTRDLETFTCFWEAPAEKSYYFFYEFDK